MHRHIFSDFRLPVMACFAGKSNIMKITLYFTTAIPPGALRPMLTAEALFQMFPGFPTVWHIEKIRQAEG